MMKLVKQKSERRDMRDANILIDLARRTSTWDREPTLQRQEWRSVICRLHKWLETMIQEPAGKIRKEGKKEMPKLVIGTGFLIPSHNWCLSLNEETSCFCHPYSRTICNIIKVHWVWKWNFNDYHKQMIKTSNCNNKTLQEFFILFLLRLSLPSTTHKPGSYRLQYLGFVYL